MYMSRRQSSSGERLLATSPPSDLGVTQAACCYDETKTMSADKAARLHAKMEEQMVTGYEPLIAVMQNDAKDRHVVAAALKAGAQVIATANLKDFTPLPDGIEAQSPDEFLCNLFDLDPPGFVEILREQGADLQRPPVTFEELLERLSRAVPDLVATVREHLEALGSPQE